MRARGRGERARPEVILLDLMLGATDGMDLLSELKSHPRTAGIPIIVMSGATEEDFRQRPGHEHASLFMTKSMGMTQLPAAIKAVMKGGVGVQT